MKNPLADNDGARHIFLTVSFFFILFGLFEYTTLHTHILENVADVWLERATKNPCEAILTSNSYGARGVDARVISKKLQKNFCTITDGGKYSWWWYAVLANIAIQQKPPPNIFVVLFTETRLTDPFFNERKTKKEIESGLANISAGTEPNLASKLNLFDMPRWAFPVYRHSKLYRQRSLLKEQVYTYAKDFASLILGVDPRAAPGMIRTVMQPTSIASKMPLPDGDRFNFLSRVQDSFLPEMLSMAKAHDIQIIFVLGKTKIPPTPANRIKMEKYSQDLRSYLENNEAKFIDFTNDTRLHSSLFGSNYHLSPEGRAIFSEMLGDELYQIVEL